MVKFAVVLAGNGVFDGAEIHESVLTLYAIQKNNATYDVFAPDIEQHHVVNHITGKEMPEKRNVLIESARIARGKIRPLSDFDAQKYDALIFPGGFGVAKNLCSFAFDGTDCKVDADTEKAVRSMIELKKPIGALCIAPALITKILGDVEVTVGQDRNTINSIRDMGGIHKNTNHGEIVIDRKYKLVTSPCYMLDANIVQIAEGADNVVQAILDMID